MRILVTGGAGFIGSHLVDALLARGEDVLVLDNLSTGRRENLPEQATLVVGDVSDAPLVKSLMDQVDACVHLAAVASVQKSIEDWVNTHRTNLSGTIAVLDAARPRGVAVAKPVTFASSAAVYGDNPAIPLIETTRLRPTSAYGADKLGCELHGDVAARLFGVPVTALRFFNVFGPRQDPSSPYSGVISLFADKARRGETLCVYGDGMQTRDFVYVSDVVQALMASVRRTSPEFLAVNVCTGKPSRIVDIIDALSDLYGRKLTVEFGPPRSGDIRTSIGDAGQLESKLGIKAGVSLQDGLKQLLTLQ